MEDIKEWLWLNSIQDVGPVRAKSLLDSLKSPKVIINESKNRLQKVEGIGPLIAESIISSKNQTMFLKIEKELTNIQKNNISIINVHNKNYPGNLKNIYDSPILLYVKGNILNEDNNSIAIVGSRNATSYGLKAAYDLAKGLAKHGITIISGMARGIDTQAHKGALDAGGRTIAVLGCGLDVIYPRENKKLMDDIANNGAVISEFPLETIPDSKNFPQRNRIISGISRGTIIIEATQKSGSLITADFALEQGREVFAVPGPIYSRFSEGTNSLIKDGAKLVTCVEDILEELKINYTKHFEQVEINIPDNLSDEESKVYGILSYEPLHFELLALKSGFSINKINAILTMLELKGNIKQLPGKQFIRM